MNAKWLRFVLFASCAMMLVGCSREARKQRALEAAETHFKANDFDRAEVEYLNALKNDPLNAQAIARLGLIYAEQGRTGPAIAYLVKANELRPEDPEVLIKIAHLKVVLAQPEEARAAANRLLDRQADHPEAPLVLAASLTRVEDVEPTRERLKALASAQGAPVQTALGMIELRLGRLKEAEEFFRRAQSVQADYAPSYTGLAAVLAINRDLAGATAAYQKAAELSPPRSPRRLQHAQFLLKNNDPTAGRKLLEEVTQNAPDYLPAWLARAEVALSDKQYDEAEQLIARALSRDGGNLEAQLMRARLRIAQGRVAEALVDLERLARDFPGLPSVHFELGRAHSAAGDNAKAATALTQAVKLAPNFADAIMPLAALHITKAEFDDAVVLLRRLIQQRPDLPQAMLLLADAYRGQGNLDGAMETYRLIDERYPQNRQTALLKGQVLVQQNKRPEARAALEKAREFAPDNPAALELLVGLDIRERQHAAARDRVQSAAAAHPTLAGPAQLLLARIALAQNDRAAAETAVRKAIELMPENQTAYFMLAGIYNANNEAPKALASLQEAVARDPSNQTAQLLIGVIQEKERNFAPARDAYEKVLAQNPRAGVALNNLAYLYAEKLNQREKALELAQRARELMPADPHVADTLGWILYRLGQYARALPLLQEAHSKRPDSGEVAYHLGMTNYMMGDEAAARALLKQSLEDKAGFSEADDARRSLALLESDVSSGSGATRSAIDAILAVRKQDPVALTRLAAIQQREGRLDEAAATLASALSQYDRNVPVLVALARVHADRKDSAKALQFAKAARQYAPLDGTIAHTLGRLAFDLGDRAWAAGLLQEAARRLPPSPALSYDVARASYSIGQVQEAEAALQRAVEGGPSLQSADARRMLELIGLAAKPQEAVRQSARISEILRAEPSSVPALIAAGVAAEQRGELAAARQNFEKALATYPDFTPAKVRLAVLGAAQPKFDQKSYDWAMQARTAYPRDSEVAKVLGVLTYRRGDHARAESLLREASATRAEDAEVWFYLAHAQHGAKKTADSKASLERALSLGLSAELTSQANRLLAELK